MAIVTLFNCKYYLQCGANRQCDISYAIRLSSVWPVNFQYHSQAAAAATGMWAMLKWRRMSHLHKFKHLKKLKVVFWEFSVVGR